METLQRCWKNIARVAALGVLYYAVARMGLWFSFEESNVSPVWPAAGLALAGVLFLGPRAWPGIWLGAFAVNAGDFFHTAPVAPGSILWVCALVATGNTLEALAGWWVCHRWSAHSAVGLCREPWFPQIHVFHFAALSLLVALVGACVGATAVCAAGFEQWARVWLVGLIWWSGDATGLLFITPFLLAWGHAPAPRLGPAFRGEAVAAFLLLGLSCAAVFRLPLGSYPYLIIPPLVWIAARLGPRALTSGLVGLAAWAVWESIHARGPFADGSEHFSLLRLSVFLWVANLTSMALGSTVMALEKLSEELEARVEGRTSEARAIAEVLRAESRERARSAEDAQLARKRYEALAANFPNGAVFLFDQDLRYMVADGMGLKALALSKSILEGKTIWEALPPETARALEPHYQAALAGSTELFEVPYANRDFLVHALPVRDAQGHVFAGMAMCQDISAQKVAETALREERNFSAAVIETVSALILVLDREGRIVEFNRACQTITGYSAAEVIGQCIWELPLLVPEEVARLKEVFSKLSAGEFPNQVENYWVAKDGHHCLITWSNALLLAEDGSVGYFVGAGIDITEQRRAENALRQSEERLMAIVETALDAIISADASGVIIGWNKGAGRIFGYAEQDVLGQAASMLMPERYRHAYERALEGLRTQGDVRHLREICADWRALRKDGSEFPIDLSLSSWKLGGESFFTSIIRDITERDHAEEALRQSEARLAAFMDNLPGVASMKDPQGRYLDVRGQIDAIFGTPLDELVGKSVEDFCPPELAAEIRFRDELVLETGRPIQSLETISSGNLLQYWLVNQFPILDKTGARVLVGAIRIDITERVRTEQRLKEALAKEVVLRREIHHRVKNNLQVIISLLYLQSAHIRDPKTLEILRESQVRTRSIAVTHELLSQSEDLSKIDMADYVRQLTTHLLSAYEVNVGSVSLVIHAEKILLSLDTALPCGLIITELLSNALKYAFPGGSTGTICIDLRSAHPPLVSLTVSDDGVGLPAGLDVKNSPTMGLKLVHDLTRQMGGTIEFKVDQGTRVTVTFANPDPGAPS